MNRDDASLLDIARAARLVQDFCRGMTKSQFLNDLKTQSAVLHQLLILGEAVKRLSANFRKQHTTIPWRLIAGMRDKLIHGYDSIDLNEVWKTASQDMLNLLNQIDPLLPQKPDE
ncbi:MAG: DUF86 domain-containing protein [Ardenticatenaceae bacterium]|nr:MAG: DUF86 domain-containing protein [Ardenticatenaceae bacterium]